MSSAPCAASAARIGAGLSNLGNTCFLNASLQCLLHTVPLVQHVRSLGHHTDHDADGVCYVCALRDLMVLCQCSDAEAVSPMAIVANLSNISSSFERFRQEDAHEFLLSFLDKLDDCLKEIESVRRPSLSDTGFIQQTFGGSLLSVVRCCECGHCSEMVEPMLDLCLAIDDVESLDEALSSFTKVEVGDADTKMRCDGCKSQVSFDKQLKFHQLPPVIVIQLKRFKNNDGGSFEKIDKHISYPMELDMKPFLSSDDNVDVKYELYAVVVHSGFLYGFGHYYCYIRSSPESWHKMDDDMVSGVSTENVCAEEAYLLFYIKCGSSPWFSSLTWNQNVDASLIVESKTPTSMLDCIQKPCSFTPHDTTIHNNLEVVPFREFDSQIRNCSDLPASKAVADDTSCIKAAASNPILNDAVEVMHTRDKTMFPSGKQLMLLDVFSDDSSDGEKDCSPSPPSVMAHKEAKTPTGATPRMQEVINMQLGKMCSAKRKALMACLPPSAQVNIQDHCSSDRRQRPKVLA